MGQWYLHVGGDTYGPVETDIVEHWIGEKRVSGNHLIWAGDEEKWIALADYPLFSGLFAKTSSQYAAALSQEATSSIAPREAAHTAIVFPIEIGPDGARRHARTPVQVAVRWARQAPGVPKVERRGEAIDISVSGLSFRAVGEVHPGEIIKIHVDIMDGRPAFALLADVKRVVPSLTPGEIEIGCEYRLMTPSATSYLLDRLESVSALVHPAGAPPAPQGGG